MDIYFIIYSIVLLAVVFFGLRRVRQAAHWRNVLAEQQLILLQYIINELKNKN